MRTLLWAADGWTASRANLEEPTGLPLYQVRPSEETEMPLDVTPQTWRPSWVTNHLRRIVGLATSVNMR